MKTLVLGIGNPILSDDGVGLEVAEVIKRRLSEKVFSQPVEYPKVDVKGVCSGGLRLLDEICDYDRVILVDSIKTDKGRPGEVYRLTLDDIGNVSHLSSSHGVDFATVVELGRKLGYKIPPQIEIFAVEVEDNTTFCEKCTESVRKRISSIANWIVEMISEV